MAAVKALNPNADTMGANAALFMNINAAKGLFDVMKTNLGPKGTIKMLVGGAGDIKLTKDGNVLLKEMQIQNPTAVMIARTAVAQDDITGDGTTSTVLLIGELMKQAERYLTEGTHPRVIVEGYDTAKKAILTFMDSLKIPVSADDRDMLECVARTSLRTKLQEALADQLTGIVTDAILSIRSSEEPIDLHMVEIMHMKHKLENDTKLIKGLVLDHGGRHPDMPRRLENCYILSCNISLEFEKSEINSGFFYSSAQDREKLVTAEREVTNARVQQVIDLKRKVCDTPDKTMVVINQKGIDPISLDLLAREGILALRRAKRRNMERLMKSCGGFAINSEKELTPDCLGKADLVYQHKLGEENYTFVEGVQNSHSCTILIKGPNDHSIAQIKEAVRDGLRAVKNTLDDGCVMAGAGAFEIAAAHHLRTKVKGTVEGRVKLGIEAFAEALLGIPKILAENSGYDALDSIIGVQEEHEKGNIVGLDVESGEPFDPKMAGVFDNVNVKRQIIESAPLIATQFLLVDEVMRAGVNMRKR
ncbi:hypothetical protein BSKO_00728 [Bryopsis sp. KO-2023]|nr:hypothetical protein BSKO_00728 [Bryopsis sp. KO-2023]